MTEKRFNLVGSYLYDGDECISHFDDPKHRDEIVELLNDFYNENERLKSRVDYLERKIQRERASAMKQHEKWEKELNMKIEKERGWND